eukprot:4493177-Amphidinium_carterae.1
MHTPREGSIFSTVLLAQWLERWSYEPQVVRSNPTGDSALEGEQQELAREEEAVKAIFCCRHPAHTTRDKDTFKNKDMFYLVFDGNMLGFLTVSEILPFLHCPGIELVQGSKVILGGFVPEEPSHVAV